MPMTETEIFEKVKEILIEALASGLPVAAFPVMGPRDVITSTNVGALDADLRRAVLKALTLNPSDCVEFARQYTWEASIAQFAANMREVLQCSGYSNRAT